MIDDDGNTADECVEWYLCLVIVLYDGSDVRFFDDRASRARARAS